MPGRVGRWKQVGSWQACSWRRAAFAPPKSISNSAVEPAEISLINQRAETVDRFREVNRFGEELPREASAAPRLRIGVNIPSAITLENNDIFRPSDQTENRFGQEVGGAKETGVEHSLGCKLLIIQNIAISST